MPLLLYLANIFKQYTKSNSFFPTRKKNTSNISEAKTQKKINPPTFSESKLWGGRGRNKETEYNNQILQIFKNASLKIKPLEGKENQTPITTNKPEVFKDLISIVRESAIAFLSKLQHAFLTYQHIL